MYNIDSRINISTPEKYSKAMDSWFWDCPRCKEKIRIELSISLTEYNIKGERVCKQCFDLYEISSIPRIHKKLLYLRKQARELKLKYDPICRDQLMTLDEESDDYIETALRYLYLIDRECLYLEKKILKRDHIE